MNQDRIESLIKNILDTKDIKLDSQSREKYGSDWSAVKAGDPIAVIFPRNTLQLIDVINLCNMENIPFIGSGGRTGLSGGATAVGKELIISFEKMNKVLDFDEHNKTVVCEPGLITQNLQKFALKNNLFYPIDFSSTGSSQIGGNIATNAGGIRVIKHGLTSKYVDGIEAVSGLGEVYHYDQQLIKNATGPDFKNLFIGSEGIFGLTTSCRMKLIDIPRESTLAMIGFDCKNNLDSIRDLICINNDIEAIEFFTKECLKKVNEKFSIESPLVTESNYYLIVEYTNDNLQAVFEKILLSNFIEDVVISQNNTQKNNIWKNRLLISESISEFKPHKFDLAVPVKNFTKLVQKIENLATNLKNTELFIFGHIGDGNLHVNFISKDRLKLTDKDISRLESEIFNITHGLKGTISAEHGIGYLKRSLLVKQIPKNKYNLLKSIKRELDPKNLLNPGKIIF